MATSGRNRDLGPYRDGAYTRCKRCGFMCNTDRDRVASDGSRAGYGITYKQVYNQTTITNGVVTSKVTTT